ncbi:MAG: response regulator [Balneolaceae bacterium]
MIIEDDQIQTIALKQIVQRMGHSIVGMFLDPEIAISEIPELQPDLILSDINLETPVDGIDVIYQIQRTHTCPVIFLTGYSLHRMSERIHQIDHSTILSKPYTVKELSKEIATALGETPDDGTI